MYTRHQSASHWTLKCGVTMQSVNVRNLISALDKHKEINYGGKKCVFADLLYINLSQCIHCLTFSAFSSVGVKTSWYLNGDKNEVCVLNNGTLSPSVGKHRSKVNWKCQKGFKIKLNAVVTCRTRLFVVVSEEVLPLDPLNRPILLASLPWVWRDKMTRI